MPALLVKGPHFGKHFNHTLECGPYNIYENRFAAVLGPGFRSQQASQLCALLPGTFLGQPEWVLGKVLLHQAEMRLSQD